MNIFGSYSKQVKKHKLEKEPAVSWVFHYPTSDNEVFMERYWRTNPTAMEVFVVELALTFEETNLGVDDEGGEPYITKEKPLDVRRDLIRRMPTDLILELARALNTFCPGWGAQEEEAE
jgi:hypothetical protein